MRIGIDMMGGDYAPQEAVKGVVQYLQSSSAIDVTLIGDEQQVKSLLTDAPPTVRFVHAPDVIGMQEHPTKALKEKTNSSIAIGFKLLATGEIDAFISAGNTGAMMVGTFYSIKSIEGVLRPTISTIIPKLDGSFSLLLDVGLNADCKAENLLQFAILGSLYAQHILKIDDPKVGLVNVGEEEGKGNLLAQAAYPLLKASEQINFLGNIEGRDILQGKADVMVCEGFTGNVILKMAESLYDVAVHRGLKDDEYFHRFHYENYGGTPILGVSKPVIIGHGISEAPAFKNMIILAQKMLESDLLGKMKSCFVA
ncbi:phosphate acyltransferase PlsX [Dinghuibacter silviterrae]|uniref:Phosphate acyltransferase n=1 Tax=Dinghuibacter silviterrae TaxID=1539049 RepID=A0A4R8DGG8_9BACT|nr:phosphate acyltransferase PlsX [Dinghuibacter silviterrae]TDW96206.1 phosphate:acyl-[acyl carrier protein] acyltransferase [Dinghuibacter silviterrae]